MPGRGWHIWCAIGWPKRVSSRISTTRPCDYGANELLPAVIPPRVFVSAVDAEAARHIVADFKTEGIEADGAEVSRHVAVDDVARPEFLHGDREESEDPEQAVCPQCRRGRMTVCPYCETASAEFRPADDPPAASGERPTRLLLCTTCDEPFEPDYYRRCEWCGHDFGSGIELERKAVVDYLNDRVIVAMMGLAVAVLAIFDLFRHDREMK